MRSIWRIDKQVQKEEVRRSVDVHEEEERDGSNEDQDAC